MNWKQGTPVGEYRILHEIRRGSKGAVYFSNHAETGEQAALVVLQGVGGEDPSLERWIESLSALHHPNIAPVKALYRFDELRFIVSDFPEGPSLKEIFDPLPGGNGSRGPNGKSRTELAVRIMRDITCALDYAHGHGLAHSDLRAEDIVLPHDGVPVMVGFGWSFMIQDLNRGALQGDRLEQVDPRRAEGEGFLEGGRDVQAAGRILYEMCTGTSLQELERTLPASRHCGLPGPIANIVVRSLHCGPADRGYSAGTFQRDLEQFLSPQPVTVQPRRRPEKRKRQRQQQFPFMKPVTAFRSRVSAVCLVGVLVLVALTGLLPQNLKRLYARMNREAFLEALAGADEIREPGLRMEALSRILEKHPGAPGSAEVHLELGRLCVQEGRWQEGLKAFFLAHYLDPHLALGRDLLNLASMYYDAGHTHLSDRIFDRVMDWYQGTDPAWEAILLKKHFRLQPGALGLTAASIEQLVRGPMERLGSARDMAERLLGRIRSITLNRYPRKGTLQALGDFLPSQGEEIARLDRGRLEVSSRDGVYGFDLEEDPLLMEAVNPQGDGRDEILLVYADGRVEVRGPAEGRLLGTLYLKGRPVGDMIPFRDGGEDGPWAILTVVDREMTSLALIHGTLSREGMVVAYHPLKGGPPRTILALGSPSRRDRSGRHDAELLVIDGDDLSSRIIPLACRTEESTTEEGTTEESKTGGNPCRPAWNLQLHGTATCAAVFDGSVEESPAVLVAVSSGYPEAAKSGPPRLRAGIYRLTGTEVDEEVDKGAAAGVDGGPSARGPSLTPLKLIVPIAGNGVRALVQDACVGDFNGDGKKEAAFLVHYPGWMTFEPQTRILMIDKDGGSLWFHCPDAVGLDRGDLDGDGRDELVVDHQRYLLGVTF